MPEFMDLAALEARANTPPAPLMMGAPAATAPSHGLHPGSGNLTSSSSSSGGNGNTSEGGSASGGGGADIDQRAMPMLFGVAGAGDGVMANWMGGLLGPSTPADASPLVPAPPPPRPQPPQGAPTPKQPQPRKHKQPFNQSSSTSVAVNDTAMAAAAAAATAMALPIAGAANALGRGVGPRRVLVLLDMNGTLLLRLKGKLGREKPSFAHAGLQYYLRRGVVDLVASLRSHPHCELAFYTSMRESNALPAVLAITSGAHVEIYDRDYNKADKEEGVESWDTMRDLAKIWSTEGKVGYGFGPHNTIMVDDSARKMRHAPRNLVQVPEFKHAEHMRDGTMTALHAHLQVMLDDFGESFELDGPESMMDVRSWCDANPPTYPPPPMVASSHASDSSKATAGAPSELEK